jgi:predicted anti-sigma-YlaC factor YlaD
MIELIMRRLVLACLFLMALPGCLKRLALGSVADGLSSSSGGSGSFSREDDPELVRDSLPVIIELMQQIHDSIPDHHGLTTSLAQAVTSYGAGFLGEEADRLEEKDVEAAKPIRLRAKRLFLRGRGYGLDALEQAVPGLKAALLDAANKDQLNSLLAKVKKDDVPALYWTAAAWGSAIASSKDDMVLVGQLPQVALLMKRALELDESWSEGSIHEFFITYDASTQGAGKQKAKEHFERAVALSHGHQLSAYVTFAEAVDVGGQDKKDFTKQLDKVLAFDVNSDPDHRLVNVLAQRRAKWLLSRTADLFVE